MLYGINLIRSIVLNKIDRKSNFELLRIVCMIMIVMLHTLGHGNALESLNIYSKNFIVSTMFKSLSIVAVNCYVLITGFFGMNMPLPLENNVLGWLIIIGISVILWFILSMILKKFME